MAYSRIVYPGDGVQTQFQVNFALGILKREDVTGRVGSEVDGFGQPAYRTLTWINDGLIDIAGTGVAPGGAAGVFVLQRTVSKTVLVHDYADGAPIIEDNLDESNKQNIMLVHEALDGRFGTLQQDLDFGGFRGVNAADPSLVTDLATKGYVDLQLSVGNGNVPVPGAPSVGKFLKALTATTWNWASLTLADLGVSFPLILSLGGTGSASLGGAQANLGILPVTGGSMSGDLTMNPGKIVSDQGADIASAATVNLAAATGNIIRVTGGVAINTFGNPQDGAQFTVIFLGTPQINHNYGGAQPILLLSAQTEIAVVGVPRQFQKISGSWYEVGASAGGDSDLFNYFNFV